jgi:hypothetical protein
MVVEDGESTCGVIRLGGLDDVENTERRDVTAQPIGVAFGEVAAGRAARDDDGPQLRQRDDQHH